MAGANMSRNESLAGQSVKQGGYTVTYDKNGYAKKAVKDGGASATSSKKTTHANDSAAHNEAYEAAKRGDWDAVGIAVNKIGMSTPDGNGGYDMSDANAYMKELSDQFGYNSKDYYDKKYEQAYGDGASKQSGTIAGTGGASGGVGPAAVGTGWNDASQYLKDMYAQKNAAELAALKSTYEQNVADSMAQDDLITSAYDKQRNQAAAQNDLQRMYMNEYGIMRGLNTGASGQMALAQSAAYQGNMAQLGAQEAKSLADNALTREKLAIAYSNAVDQAAAEGDYQLAQALYNEYVRQDELARQAAAAEQEQANWLEKFNYQKEQDALAQKNWQAQFDYQKAQDDLNYQLTLQKLYGANVGSTGSPVKTPSVGYNNGNLTNEQVKVLQNHYGVTADGLWGKNSTNAAGGLTAAQAWEQFTAPVTDVSQLSANGIAVANSLARGYTTGTQQRDAIINAYENGRITQGEAAFLARAVGVSL